MNDGNASVPLEIVEIEAQDLVHLVHHHRCNDSVIVDLNPGDPVIKHKLSPSWENLRRLRKEPQERLKAIQVSSSLLGRDAETISSGGPSGNIPEFDKVLWKAE